MIRHVKKDAISASMKFVEEVAEAYGTRWMLGKDELVRLIMKARRIRKKFKVKK